MTVSTAPTDREAVETWPLGAPTWRLRRDGSPRTAMPLARLRRRESGADAHRIFREELEPDVDGDTAPTATIR